MANKISMKESLDNKNGCGQDNVDCLEECSFTNECIVLEIEGRKEK